MGLWRIGLRSFTEMKQATLLLVCSAALAYPGRAIGQMDAFGSGTNAFKIEFVAIGNPGNAVDVYPAPGAGYGAVSYEYRIGAREISQNQIDKATRAGLANVTAGAWVGGRPAANINWYEAAAFVNWLNTSTGRQGAYDLTWDGTVWSMNLWSSSEAWTAGGTNLYRHKDTYYFLPSEDEWYKAAYYNAAGTNYFLYPTGSDSAPAAVVSGTNVNTAVFFSPAAVPVVDEPSEVSAAGGLSAYGTMGQGGNVMEWNETAYTGINSLSSEQRAIRGGSYIADDFSMRASSRNYDLPTFEGGNLGFRVASVPEPSTYLLVLLGAGALYALRRRQGRSKN